MNRKPVPFPRPEETEKLIPVARWPYALARMALQETGIAFNRMSVEAVRILHKAHEKGVLRPPLEGALAEAVTAAASNINEHGHTFGTFNYESARNILDAVFEHAYRSDCALSTYPDPSIPEASVNG